MDCKKVKVSNILPKDFNKEQIIVVQYDSKDFIL